MKKRVDVIDGKHLLSVLKRVLDRKLEECDAKFVKERGLEFSPALSREIAFVRGIEYAILIVQQEMSRLRPEPEGDHGADTIKYGADMLKALQEGE